MWHLEAVSPEDLVQSPQERAIVHVAARSHGGPLDPALRVTLNFHPDRLAGGVTTLEAMARDGTVRSQFETGTSNGGLTAHPGGDRWRVGEPDLRQRLRPGTPVSAAEVRHLELPTTAHRRVAALWVISPAPKARDLGQDDILLPRQRVRAVPLRCRFGHVAHRPRPSRPRGPGFG
jgi:hypothetical protein